MRAILLALPLTIIGLATAQAQGTGSGTLGPNWDVEVGAGIGYAPDYEGSDDMEAFFLPVVNVSYRDFVFIDGSRQAIGVNVFRRPNFRAGPIIRGRNDREAGDTEDLAGFNDIDYAIELGVFAEGDFGPFTVGLDMTQDVNEAHEGFVAELSGAYTFVPSPRLRVILGASTTYVSDNYANSYFGVTAAEAGRNNAARAGANIGAYDAEGGIKDIGFSATATYALTQQINVTGIASLSRLLGDAADSPIVEELGDANQLFFGAAVSYRF